MQEGNRLDLKMLTVVELVVSPPDRRTPTGEATADGHLDLMMLMELGDREGWRCQQIASCRTMAQ